MSTAVGRERRKTAGRRMNTLVGEALEQDDAFWGHDTWNDEDEDSGNDSFRESDEDSELRKDVFDSDFDDSETDNEDEEAAAGEAEERELRQSERDASNRQRGRGKYVDSKSKRGRGIRPTGMRRVVGEGFNKGIVLNFPPSAAQLASTAQQPPPPPPAAAAPSSTTAPSATATSSLQTPETALKKPPPTAAPVPAVPPATRTRSSRSSVPSGSSRERRSTHGSRKLRDHRSTPAEKTTTPSSKQTAKKSAAASNAAAASRAAKRRRYGQEELILEAVHQTEPENKRWLYGRKRIQDQHEKDLNASNAALRDRTRGKVVEKFHSRRGALTTLTFPEMDAVPEILTRQPTRSTKNDATSKASIEDGATKPPTSSRSTTKTVCVITGKPAKYKDPLTKLPYYDLKAFKELRRRHETKGRAMEIVTETKPINGSTTSTNPAAAVDGRADNKKSESTTDGKQKKPQAARIPTSRPSNNGKKPDGAKRKSKPKLKKSISSSKLPFQSPKPPKAAPSTDTIGENNDKNPDGSKAQVQGHGTATAGATTVAASANTGSSNSREVSAALSAQKSPIVEKLAFSWGDTPSGPTSNDSNGSSLSPSGRRLSRRKWKPSEKIIDAIATSPSKDGVITTPAGMKIKTQPVIGATEIATISVPSLAPDATIESTSNPPVDSQQKEPIQAVSSSTTAEGGKANGTASNYGTKNKDESTTNSQSNESSGQTQQQQQQPQQSGTETSSAVMAPNPSVSTSNMNSAETKPQPQPQQQQQSLQVDQAADQEEHTKETKTIESNGSPPPPASSPGTGPKVTSEATST